MPVIVALEQQPGLAVGGPERAVLLDVGEVDGRRVVPGVDLDEDALQRAEAFAEGDLRLFGEMLAGEDQHGVGVPSRLDGREGLVVERVQPHAAHRRAESGVCRRDVERHGPLLSRRLSLYSPGSSRPIMSVRLRIRVLRLHQLVTSRLFLPPECSRLGPQHSSHFSFTAPGLQPAPARARRR